MITVAMVSRLNCATCCPMLANMMDKYTRTMLTMVSNRVRVDKTTAVAVVVVTWASVNDDKL